MNDNKDMSNRSRNADIGLTRVARGRAAEQLAVNYLVSLGYELIARNWRCTSGEIDAIMRDGDMWVFVEVRSVTEAVGFGTAVEAIHARKQQQVRQLALRYLSSRRLDNVRLRCDAVAITYYKDGSQPKIQHVVSAF